MDNDRYRLGPVLMRTPRGEVHKALDTALNRFVALELVSKKGLGTREAAGLSARFMLDVQTAARLHHPNILPVHDHGETDAYLYVVSELVDGRPLRDLLRNGNKPPVGLALTYTAQVLSALAHAHAQGAVHGAVVPGCILITEHDTAKLGDFWLGRLVDAASPELRAFLAPEQVCGGVAEARSDVFAAGVLLYRLLTGEMPFAGSDAELAAAIREKVPPAPSRLNEALPAKLDPVIMRALAKRPEERFQTAEAFRANLLGAGAALMKQAPPPPKPLEVSARAPFARLKLKPGEVIFEQDQKGDRAYLIESGAVRIVMHTRGGGSVILATLGRGEIFGEMALVDDEPRMASAVAAEETTLVVVPRDDFQARINRVDKVTHKLLNVLVNRIRSVATDLADLKTLVD